jgi:hypothetical protein
MEYHEAFLRFLEYVRDAKDRRRFSNMEKNLYTALKCNATLALYGQTITHPYMREICGKANRHTNMLDLGPLHKKVEEHIQRISNNPDILLSQTASYTTGALDGLKWERPGAVAAILAMKENLPHLSAVISAFFSGALETWKRFTTEFTPGGIIDGATDCEKELAWVPATNDANESILGVLRQFMRYHPNASLALFNAQMKYQRNGTQEWEEKYVEDDDYKYVMNRVRAEESTGADKNRKKKLILAQIGKVGRERAARKKAQRKKKERNARIAKVALIFDKDVIDGLKGQKLTDQIAAFALAGAPLPRAKDRKIADDKRKAIKKVIDKFKSGDWSLKGPQEEESSTEEYDDDSEDPDN